MYNHVYVQVLKTFEYSKGNIFVTINIGLMNIYSSFKGIDGKVSNLDADDLALGIKI